MNRIFEGPVRIRGVAGDLPELISRLRKLHIYLLFKYLKQLFKTFILPLLDKTTALEAVV